ncbi:bifunctional phosphopantothenoylcysteine decarboxylase/phosphopantothenate--cysteine ligase CoaBC [Lachnospiraceae bacterium YH-ros2228]
MLQGKNILLGVTGGIAAYKTCDLASMLMKAGALVNVIETENAAKFVTPLTFDALTHQRTVVDTFDRQHSYEIEHIALSDKADAVLVAPASADIIAKLANGLADDMLTTTILAMDRPKLIAPAMNTRMYENPVTQHNLDLLRGYGWEIIEPVSGHLACGTSGKGKMASPERLFLALDHAIAYQKDLTGKRILVSAGPTREALDPVRYLTNHSSGRMGYAIAKIAADRGARVTLVSGPTELTPSPYVECIPIESAEEMFHAVSQRACAQDAVIMAAAVADFRPASVADNKIKKKEGESLSSLSLEGTKDILEWLGRHKPYHQLLCGFSMETEHLLENSRKKLEKKNLDLIAANSLKEAGAGFGVDTNILTLISKDKEEKLPLMSKEEAANVLLDRLFSL